MAQDVHSGTFMYMYVMLAVQTGSLSPESVSVN